MRFSQFCESHAGSDAIRTGMKVREDFWDDFLAVTNDAAGLSALLDVPATKIAGWHAKVRAALAEVKAADGELGDKKRLIKTGLPEF